MAKKKKSKAGRKPLKKSEKRIPRWKVTASASEAELIAKRANKAGESVAAYLRKRGTGEL